MKILFIDTIHPLLKGELEKLNYNCDTAYKKSKSEIEEIISNYEGIIIRSRFKIDKQFIDKATHLKFIARAGSGLENINTEYAQSKNIKCYNAICFSREANRGVELSGKTIGVIGFGNNGSAFAEALKGFDVTILAYDKYLNNYTHQSSMENIFKKADIVSLHIPLTEETTCLIDDNFINNFEKDFYLINTARGKCVNTISLIKGLNNGKIKGACLDVLEYEKTSFENLSKDGLTTEMQHLIESEKTILSPHIAGWTYESNIKIAKILLGKITSSLQ